MAHAALRAADELGLAAIVCCTRAGPTARAMAALRPSCRLIGASPSAVTARQLTLSWGVEPLEVDEYATDRRDGVVRGRGGRRRRARAARRHDRRPGRRPRRHHAHHRRAAGRERRVDAEPMSGARQPGRRRRRLGPRGGRGAARRARPRGHGPLGRDAAGATRPAVDVPRAALRPAGLRPVVAAPARPPASTSRSTTSPGCSPVARRCSPGHSFGGLVCLALAERRARPGAGRGGLRGARDVGAVVAGLVARANEAMAMPDPEDAAERFLRRMIGDATWERLPAAMRAERRAEGHALLAEMRSVRPPDAAAVHRGRRHRPGRGRVRHARPGPHHMRATDELARNAPAGRAAGRRGRGPRRAPHPPGRVRRPRAPGPRAGRRTDPRRSLMAIMARWRRKRGPGPGGLRPVGRRQPRRPPDRDAAGPRRARTSGPTWSSGARSAPSTAPGWPRTRRPPASGGWSGCGASSTARS